jgi:hypothetical protein
MKTLEGETLSITRETRQLDVSCCKIAVARQLQELWMFGRRAKYRGASTAVISRAIRQPRLHQRISGADVGGMPVHQALFRRYPALGCVTVIGAAIVKRSAEQFF